MSPLNKLLEARILAALATGQMHKRMLCAALGLDYTDIDRTVSTMVRSGVIASPGTAIQAGYTNIRGHGWMYSLPGQALFVVPAPMKKRKGSGSGIVAGRIVAREQTPLRRDPFALMKLAMETRR